MDTDAQFRRYQELQQYVGWTDADAARVQSLAAILEPFLPALVDDFYAEIDRHPAARKVITGGAAQVVRLKGTLAAWLRELLRGPYDADYVVRRWKVGGRHVDIGLDQVYTNTALSRLRRGLMQALEDVPMPSVAEALAVRRSLNTLLDLDLAIIEDAYQVAFVERQQRTERLAATEKLLQSERLAAIGQMMTGLAHESGNALARSQSCLEMLAWEVEDRTEATKLIDRIQKAQDHLKQLYDEVRGYAAPLKLEREVCDLAGVCKQAWENLAVVRKGREACLKHQGGSTDPRGNADAFRLEQVFRNILDNALAACKDPVEIIVRCAETTIDGRPAITVIVSDNGPGLSAEQKQRIFDPFFTTKTKGTGLGMAIAKRIIEAHGGAIAVDTADSGGAAIQITLPRDMP